MALLDAGKINSSKHGAYCTAAMKFFREIVRLPQQEAALLMRDIFISHVSLSGFISYSPSPQTHPHPTQDQYAADEVDQPWRFAEDDVRQRGSGNQQGTTPTDARAAPNCPVRYAKPP